MFAFFKHPLVNAADATVIPFSWLFACFDRGQPDFGRSGWTEPGILIPGQLPYALAYQCLPCARVNLIIKK